MRNQAFKLIDVYNDNIFVCKESLHKLKSMKGKIMAISIVGPVLTGKSSLLNYIINKNVFQTGETTNPQTKGVYAYIKQIKSQLFTQSVYQIFLDIQGFDNAFSQSGEKVDIQLLCFAICLSKIVMYNSFGALDSKVLQRLASLYKILPQNLQTTPEMLLVQRDFSLKLQNESNQIINKQQYLENCIRNYKEKAQINNLLKLFKSNNLNHSNNLKCFLVPNQQDMHQYNNSAGTIKKYIQEESINYLISNYSQLIPCSQFIFRICSFIELLKQNSSFNNFYSQTKQKLLLQSKNLFTSYKSCFGAHIKQLKMEFPMPKQLLMFKMNNIQKVCLVNQGCDYQNDQNYICEMIGKQKIKQFYNKMVQKMETANNTKIKQFIQIKVHQIMNNAQNNIKSLDEFTKNQQNIITNLLSYYPYISQNYKQFILFRIQTQLNIKLYNSLKCLQLQNKNNILLSQSSTNNHAQQVKLFKQMLVQKQKHIQHIQTQAQNRLNQLQKLTNQQQHKLKQSNQKVQAVIEVQTQMIKYQQRIKNYQKNGEQILKKLQNQLKQNILYERNKFSPNIQQYSQKAIEESTKTILQSVNKVLQVIQHQNKTIRDDEKRQYQKMFGLQKMNKSLRQRIQELTCSQSCIGVLQTKYELCQKQLQEKQKQIQQIICQKQLVIQKLRNQLNYKKQTISSLNLELELAKSRVTDKNKTSEFMEKLLQAKQKALQLTRKQLLQNITKHKEELNNVRSEYKDKQIQLSATLSMFILQNEQLTTKNNQLNNKLKTIQSKLKKQNQIIAHQKQEQIMKMGSNIKKLQKSMENMNDSYVVVTNNLQKSISQKDNMISKLNLQLQKLSQQHCKLEKDYENLQQRYETQQNRVQKLDIQKQQLQSKIKRQQTLAQNKIRYIEQSNERLKVQMRQKQNTFDMMLLQLRSHNIVKNNADNNIKLALIDQNNKRSTIKQQSRQKFIKRIDLIQQKTLRQLQQISNKNYNKRNIINMQKQKINNKDIKDFRSQKKSKQLQIMEGKFITEKKYKKQFKLDYNSGRNLTQSFTNLGSNQIFNNSKNLFTSK